MGWQEMHVEYWYSFSPMISLFRSQMWYIISNICFAQKNVIISFEKCIDFLCYFVWLFCVPLFCKQMWIKKNWLQFECWNGLRSYGLFCTHSEYIGLAHLAINFCMTCKVLDLFIFALKLKFYFIFFNYSED